MFHRSLFNDFSMLHKEMDALFPRFILSSQSDSIDDRLERDIRPRLNLYATETGYVLESPLPGVDEKSIDVSLTANVLTLTAEQSVEEQADVEKQWHRRERSNGKFVRRVDLPDDIDASGVKAEYRQGLLRITLPKAEEALPKKINVQVS